MRCAALRTPQTLKGPNMQDLREAEPPTVSPKHGWGGRSRLWALFDRSRVWGVWGVGPSAVFLELPAIAVSDLILHTQGQPSSEVLSLTKP